MFPIWYSVTLGATALHPVHKSLLHYFTTVHTTSLSCGEGTSCGEGRWCAFTKLCQAAEGLWRGCVKEKDCVERAGGMHSPHCVRLWRGGAEDVNGMCRSCGRAGEGPWRGYGVAGGCGEVWKGCRQVVERLWKG